MENQRALWITDKKRNRYHWSCSIITHLVIIRIIAEVGWLQELNHPTKSEV